jgi:hypothetical protein
MSTTTQRLGKHTPVAKNTHTTTEEPLESVFSMQSVPRLYNKDQQDKQDMSCEREK